MFKALKALILAGAAFAVAATPLTSEAQAAGYVGLSGTATVSPDVQLVGQGGNFSFGSTICVAAGVNGGPGAGVCAVTGVTGTYANIVCGTGMAGGAGTYNGPLEPANSPIAFSITFAGTVGVLTGSIGGATVAGVVQISAGPGQLAVGNGMNCASGFTATTAGVVAQA